MVFSGKVDLFVMHETKLIKLQTLGKGKIFGIGSALDQVPSDCSYQVASREAILLKIELNYFLKYFRQDALDALRVQLLMHKNWLRE